MSTTEITNTEELRDALSRLWLAEYECSLARAELKLAQKRIMAPVMMLKEDIKILQPKIQSYMLKNDMTRVRSEGREFVLKARNSKRKLDVSELCTLFETNDIHDDHTINTLKSAAVTKTSHRVVVPIAKEQKDKVVDLH